MSPHYPPGQDPVDNQTNQARELDDAIDKGIENAENLEDAAQRDCQETTSGIEDIPMPQEMGEEDYTPEGSIEEPAYEVITDFFSVASEQIDELFSSDVSLDSDNYDLRTKGVTYGNGELTEEAEAFQKHFLYDFDENVRGLTKIWQDKDRISRDQTSEILSELSDVESLKAFDDIVSRESIDQVNEYVDSELFEDAYLLESGEPTERAEELMETTRSFYQEVVEITADRVEQYRTAAEGNLDIQKQEVNGNFNALRSQDFNPYRKDFN